MNLNASTETGLVIDLVIVVLIVGRQLAPRRLRGNLRLPAILFVLGVLELGSYLGTQHHAVPVLLATGGSLVLAAATGALRVPSFTIWVHDGQYWIRGSWITAILWLVSLGAHLGYDALVTRGTTASQVGDVTVLLYLAVSLAIQRALLLQRASRQEHAGTLPASREGTHSLFSDPPR